jgi:hypothetical protein
MTSDAGLPDEVDSDGSTECIEDGCDETVERVVCLYGGVAPVCDDHADERLDHPDAVDQTAYFKGERDEPKPEPKSPTFSGRRYNRLAGGRRD